MRTFAIGGAVFAMLVGVLWFRERQRLLFLSMMLCVALQLFAAWTIK